LYLQHDSFFLILFFLFYYCDFFISGPNLQSHCCVGHLSNVKWNTSTTDADPVVCSALYSECIHLRFSINYKHKCCDEMCLCKFSKSEWFSMSNCFWFLFYIMKVVFFFFWNKFLLLLICGVCILLVWFHVDFKLMNSCKIFGIINN